MSDQDQDRDQDQFSPPESSKLVPIQRERMISNQLTGERLAHIFDILAATAEVEGCVFVSVPMLWEHEDDPQPEVGQYIPRLILTLQRVEPEEPDGKSLTGPGSDDKIGETESSKDESDA